MEMALTIVAIELGVVRLGDGERYYLGMVISIALR